MGLTLGREHILEFRIIFFFYYCLTLINAWTPYSWVFFLKIGGCRKIRQNALQQSFSANRFSNFLLVKYWTICAASDNNWIDNLFITLFVITDQHLTCNTMSVLCMYLNVFISDYRQRMCCNRLNFVKYIFEDPFLKVIHISSLYLSCLVPLLCAVGLCLGVRCSGGALYDIEG